jgi:hypothetical protein
METKVRLPNFSLGPFSALELMINPQIGLPPLSPVCVLWIWLQVLWYDPCEMTCTRVPKFPHPSKSQLGIQFDGGGIPRYGSLAWCE